MSFVTLPEAKLHLRGVDGTEEDALIGVYITAAEQMAIALLDRGVYADGTALGVAKAAAPGELDTLLASTAAIHVSPQLLDYIQALLAHSRQAAGFTLGLSPRAGLALLASARAWALLAGRNHVLPEDVQAVLPAVAGHRLRPTHAPHLVHAGDMGGGKHKRIDLTLGRRCHHHEAFDTGDMFSKHSGKGFGIYVMSPDGVINIKLGELMAVEPRVVSGQYCYQVGYPYQGRQPRALLIGKTGETPAGQALRVVYTGEESATQKGASFAAFTKGDAQVLIMSLRAGAGLDGIQASCRTVVFGELDWSPAVHHQCMGRPHRDGQTDPVAAYFLICEGGSDPVIADVLGIKKRQLEGIVDQKADAVGVQIDPGRIKRLAESFLDRHQQRVEREAVKALEEAGQSVMNFEPAPKPPAV